MNADAGRRERLLEQLVVAPGTAAGLAHRDPGRTGGAEFEQLSKEELKAEAKEILARDVKRLSQGQELLWASDTHALLVVFQAMDAAGKDSAIEHVMSGVNPQGVQVVSFRQPSSEELDHDFLWRVSKAAPERGRIGILNAADVAERARWDEYMAAYEDALSATSTPWAPWYVIPADHKWLTQALVAAILVDTIEALDLQWPEVSQEERRANLEARRRLEAES